MICSIILLSSIDLGYNIITTKYTISQNNPFYLANNFKQGSGVIVSMVCYFLWQQIQGGDCIMQLIQYCMRVEGINTPPPPGCYRGMSYAAVSIAYPESMSTSFSVFGQQKDSWITKTIVHLVTSAKHLQTSHLVTRQDSRITKTIMLSF